LDFYPFILERTSKWNNTLFFTGASTTRFFDKKNSIASRAVQGGPGFIEYYNTSILFNKNESPLYVHKSKLVLGVEKIPFSKWIPWLEELSIQNGGTSGTLGIENVPKIYKTPKFNFAPSICYESIYGSFIAEQCKKGSDIIFIITNDGWWGNTPGYKQHASFASLRAIENRKSVARSANTGISCFINQRGDVIQATKWWIPTALNGILNKNKESTFYTNNGDLIGKTFAIASLLLMVYLLFLKIRIAFGKN
jgi:apolipoprotein N-acyltransferase